MPFVILGLTLFTAGVKEKEVFFGGEVSLEYKVEDGVLGRFLVGVGGRLDCAFVCGLKVHVLSNSSFSKRFFSCSHSRNLFV